MDELKAGDIEDIGWVSRVLRGDTGAYAMIVDKYSNLIMKLAHNYLNKKEEIEDAAQEIFLEIYRSLNHFQLTRRFLPWIYSIALNVLKRKYKKQLKLRELLEKLKGTAQTLPEADPSQMVEEKDKRSIIRRAVNSLPSNLQDVVVLYYLENLNIEQICGILNLSHENIKSRLFRARKKLKKLLTEMQLN